MASIPPAPSGPPVIESPSVPVVTAFHPTETTSAFISGNRPSDTLHYPLSTRLGLPTTEAQSDSESSTAELSSHISSILATSLPPRLMSSLMNTPSSASATLSTHPTVSSTVSASDRSSSKDANMRLIIGCAVGGGVTIILIFVSLSFFLVWRRRSRDFSKFNEFSEGRTLEIHLPLIYRILDTARCGGTRMTQFHILDVPQAQGSGPLVDEMHGDLTTRYHRGSMNPSLGEGHRNAGFGRYRRSDNSIGTISDLSVREELEGTVATGETPRTRSLNSAKASSTFLGDEISFVLNIQAQVVAQMDRAKAERSKR